MWSRVRWVVAGVVVLHGMIHLLGAVKGFDLATVEALREPISVTAGAFWLLAAVLVVAAGVSLGLGRPPWWWLLTAVAAVLSQILVVSAWSDAKAGTVVNVLMLVAAGLGFASSRRTSSSRTR